MKTLARDLVLSAFITLIPTFALWLPFVLRMQSFWGIPLPTEGMATIVSNFDGPLYIVVAKTFYNAELIKSGYSLNLPVEYYAAHFPLFPILIKVFAPILGNIYAMLFVTLSGSIIATFYFLRFIREFVGDKSAIFVTILFAIFPARWLISHSVGSADPLFLASTLASLYHFRKGEYGRAGIWGALAQFTKSAGILLFIAYFGYLATHQLKKLIAGSFGDYIKTFNLKQVLSIFMIPLSLLGVFFIYSQTLGDFFAYFNSGDNIHVFFPPFQIFNYSEPWVGTFWLEEIIFIYLFGALAFIKLYKKKEGVLAWYFGVFFLSLLFVSHRDLMRYSLPLLPLVYAAFSKTLLKPEFKYAILLLIVPIYLFSLVFISQNVMPISDWNPYL